MGLNLGEERAKVRSLIKQPGTRFIEDTEIDGWLNEGADEFALRTLCVEDTALIDAVIDQAEYALTAVIKLERVGFSDGTIFPKVYYKDHREMDNLGVRGTSASRPIYYSLWKDTLELGPAPDANGIGSIKTWFYSEATTLEDDEDVSNIPERFEWGPIWYALTMAAVKMEETTLAVLFDTKYEKLIATAIKWRATKTKDKYPVVKDEEDYPDY